MRAIIFSLLAVVPALNAAVPSDYEDPELAAASKKCADLKAEYEKAQKAYDEMAQKKALEKGAVPPLTEDAVTKASAFLSDTAKLKLRASVKDKTKGTQPATLQYTRDSNGKNSRAADLGLSIEGDLPGGELGWSLLGEYHHQPKSKTVVNGVDTLLLGPGLTWSPPGAGLLESQVFQANFLYKNDRSVAGEGFLTDLTWYPYAPALLLGNEWGYDETGGLVQGRLEPFMGIQYEKGDGAPGFRDGDRFSLRAGMNLGLQLLPRYLGHRLSFDNKLIFWDHLHADGVYGGPAYDRGQWALSSSLTYWFNTPGKDSEPGKLAEADQHLGLSAGYLWGDNPEEGKLDSNVFTLGIAAKY